MCKSSRRFSEMYEWVIFDFKAKKPNDGYLA